MTGLGWRGIGALVLVTAAACGTPQASDRGVKTADANSAASWTPPTDAELPSGPLRTSILRGRALMEHTPDSLPAYVGGNLRCTSCHLNDGRTPNAIPLIAVQARFPKYMDRTGAVILLADRVNYCFTRSLAGRAIPTNSREMTDILAYLSFLSRGAPAGGHIPGEGMGTLTRMAADTTRGKALFTTTCQPCHGADGAGSALVPALWGPKSFSVGASMARLERAATFIQHNMPLGRGGMLTPQQAFDLSAYVNSHVRPDSPGKEADWPSGGAPFDVPYNTAGHVAFNPPPVLPPRDPRGMIVPAPPSVLASHQ